MSKVWVNAKQDAFLKAKQRVKVMIAGLGTGKSTLMGYDEINAVSAMPGAKCLLAGRTYGQLKNNTLPEMIAAWKRCGINEAQKGTRLGHYVIGVKPPDYFQQPFKKPSEYTNIISFINGYHIHLASLDRAELIRGVSADRLKVDEVQMIKQEHLNKILIPRVRRSGIEYRTHLHLQISLFGSMPWLLSGAWVFNYEELAKQKKSEYYFLEGKTSDNLAVLGKDYLDNMRNLLTPLEYAVEIENSRDHLTKMPDGFYPNFDEDIHVISQQFTYDYDVEGEHITQIDVYNPDLPLLLSFDFNAAFNSCIVAQNTPDTLYIIDELYDNKYQTFKSIITEFCAKYKSHRMKHVMIYGDRNGNNTSADRGKLTFYEMIMEQLASEGWTSQNTVTGLDAEHRTKHFTINEALSESNPNLQKVRIHERCKFLILSINNSRILDDFQKNKKDESNKSIDQRLTTHLSDCFDNLYFPIIKAGRRPVRDPQQPVFI
jgi:hypothetical protein